MDEIFTEDSSVALSKTFEAEPLAPSVLGLQWKVESGNLEVAAVGKEVPAKVIQGISCNPCD